MRQNKCLIFLTITFIFVSCTRDNDTKNLNSATLEYITSFGEKSTDGYIVRASHFASDYKNAIFVPDDGERVIKQFNLEGELVKTISKEGRGPGELGGGFHLSLSSQELITYDGSNQRVSFFSTGGKFISSFKIMNKHRSSFLQAEEFLIASNQLAPFQKNIKDIPLFYKYDKKGELISTFGSFPVGLDNEIPALIWRYQFVIKNGKIYVSYDFFAKLEVYDLVSEKKIATYDLSNVHPFRDHLNATDEYENLNPRTISTTKNKPLTGWGFELADSKFFFFSDVGDSLRISELYLSENNFHHKKSYSFPKEPRGILGMPDLKFIEKRNSFYSLETTKLEGFIISQYKIKDPN